ncbi:TCF3 fusion partner homolog [Anopheles bellator]|uniref:TCF3 fusion partner homolog n=1 Tax=Anopheles bellator TaxID=139047 RepID=UPI002649D8EF|nr:TCF3 fusion partner homolog [Anopheles bellator]
MTNGRPIKSQSNSTSGDATNEAYRKAAKLLHEKCKAVQRSNERLVFRLHKIQKMTRSRVRDVELLKAKLDSYGDGWRTAPDPNDMKEEGEE